jgi:hypothetical protein
MSKPIRLFISSSPDLVAEREAVSQAVAELPVAVGWEIKHTPRAGEKPLEAQAFVERCNLFVVVLGADFAAPMGLEWQGAVNAGKPVLAYCKQVLHSPAAQTVLRQPEVAWTEFRSPQQLKAQVIRGLAQAVMDQGERLGLRMEDVEGLLALARPEEQKGEKPAEPDRREGAGRGGIILEGKG